MLIVFVSTFAGWEIKVHVRRLRFGQPEVNLVFNKLVAYERTKAHKLVAYECATDLLLDTNLTFRQFEVAVTEADTVGFSCLSIWTDSSAPQLSSSDSTYLCMSSHSEYWNSNFFHGSRCAPCG